MKQQYPATLTGRACLANEGFFCGFQEIFLVGHSGVVLSGQDTAIFLPWVANYIAGFGPSCRLNCL